MTELSDFLTKLDSLPDDTKILVNFIVPELVVEPSPDDFVIPVSDLKKLFDKVVTEMIVQSDGINVRSIPSIDGHLVTTIAGNSKITILANTDQGDYVRLSAWAASKLISFPNPRPIEHLFITNIAGPYIRHQPTFQCPFIAELAYRDAIDIQGNIIDIDNGPYTWTKVVGRDGYIARSLLG